MRRLCLAFRTSGRTLDADLTAWLEGLAPPLMRRLAEIGLVDGATTAAAKPLMKAERRRSPQGVEYLHVTGGHLADYRKHLEARERSAKHIRESVSRCARLIDAQGMVFLSDIGAEKVEAYIAALRGNGASARTANASLAAFKRFCNWLKREGRITDNPVSRVGRLNEKADRRLERRALTLAETRDLIRATETGELHHGLTGHERALVYRLALESGLRYGEIYKLERGDFQLSAEPASVRIRPEDEKAGRGDHLPLRADLAADLAAYFAQNLALPTAQAFPRMWKSKGAQMLRQDLEAARERWCTRTAARRSAATWPRPTRTANAWTSTVYATRSAPCWPRPGSTPRRPWT